ncbi:hypothetical protein FACS1894139_18830 [Planctomycetales bacterium]|nr:hypothetical protein FACS1894108_12280 [Planctomycetales bacterium]GHT08804.1 hypothetical protein FACS1894139_18830 [Planctomycetales bacterium]
MIILSHRGYWQEVGEQNREVAFRRSFDLGFGAETDLRDMAGEIVISHDMPRGGEILLAEVLRIMDGRNLPLALNIKADGLAGAIKELLANYHQTNYFTFDMSIPEMAAQISQGLSVFAGQSDILPAPVLLPQSAGIWLDGFNSDWYAAAVIDNWLASGKKVCVVSGELHQRDTAQQWEIIKQCRHRESSALMLCTDVPEKAKEYFN